MPEDMELRVTASSVWKPHDMKELQEVFFKDIAVGAESLITYLMAKSGLTRQQAIEKWQRIEYDREAFPVKQQQNPESLVDGGPHAATGAGGAQKVPGAFNPEIETSTEGASIVEASENLLINKNQTFVAQQIMPKTRIVDLYNSTGSALQVSAVWGRIAREGHAIVLGSPKSAI